jgi:hypothetical protein
VYVVLTHKTFHSDQLKRIDVTVVVGDLKLTFQNFPNETKKKTKENLNNNNNEFQANNIVFLIYLRTMFLP